METVCAYGDLFHRSGLRLRVAFPLASPTMKDNLAAIDLAAQVDAYLAAGFTVREVGVEPGEESEEVGYVLRTTVDGKNGPCPRIFFYSPHAAVEYQCGSVYLNTPDDVAEFERQSGLKVATLAEWPSGAAPKKSDRGATKFITPCKAFSVVRKANPKYDPKAAEAAAAKKETYAVPKRVFVRYGGTPAAKEIVQQTANAGPDGANADDAIVNGYETEIENCQGLMDLGRIGLDIKNNHNLSDGGRAYLRGVYDGRKKYLEAASSNDSIPW